MSKVSLNYKINRQLLNPNLDIGACTKILKAVESKSTAEKEKLLFVLQKNMSLFKKQAKDFKSQEVYQEICKKIKQKIKQCENYFEVTLGDILTLIEHTDIHIHDVGMEYISPESITRMIDEYVIGQEEYSKVLGLCSYMHLYRYYHEDMDVPKMNVLAFGPSGVGKTYAVQTLATKLNMDLQIVNCNTLVEEGIQGVTPTSAFTRAYIKNNNFTHLFLLLDEFDKLLKEGCYNKRILQEYLSILDDNGEISFRTSFDRDYTYKTIPTRNVTVIIGGIFEDVKEIVLNRICPQRTNFNSIDDFQGINLYDYFQKEDFSKLFKNDELLGRIGKYVQVKSLSRETMLDIIKDENASPIIQYQNYFEGHNVTLTLTDEGAEQIIEIIEKEHLGVRGLKSILGTILTDDMWQVKQFDKQSITIDKGYVWRHLPANLANALL